MTRKNPYENQENTVDIPDFVEEKTSTESNSVDMSIFKMSDEELYDEVDSDEEEYDEDEAPVKKSKKSNGSMIFSLVLNFLLLAACAGAIFYALSQHKAYVKANTEYQQLLASQESYKQQITAKDAEIESLNKQIEDLKKAAETGSGEYVIIDGPITFRVSPSKNAESTTYKGEETANDDEIFKVLEVVKGTDDSDYKWAKVADNIYFCIGTSDDKWAKPVN